MSKLKKFQTLKNHKIAKKIDKKILKEKNLKIIFFIQNLKIYII